MNCNNCEQKKQENCKDFVKCKTEELLSAVKQTDKPIVYVGMGTCGLGAGAEKTYKAIVNYGNDIKIVKVCCIGLCSDEPIVDIEIPGRTRIAFGRVTERNVAEVIDGVLGKGTFKSENVLYQFRPNFQNIGTWDGVPFIDEHPFFKRQTRWVLENCGIIDPLSIDEYIVRGGYSGLAKTLSTHTSDEICDIIERSGLKGRGGGGFLTGKKWKIALATPSHDKYFICNADEGDPGAFMDRALIEGDPHRLLEGLIIASYAIGAEHAYIYIRAEYPLAIKNLKKAIEDATAYGLLGYNILDSGYNLDVHIKQGAGAFVCGEETALINSIEGKRGTPRPRPPFPAVSGLFGKPTIINNVETLANVPKIIKNGVEWFSSIGTEKSKGTKVFALSGKVNRTGLIEVPMGITMREIVFEIGGGIPDGKRYKAAQTGGPSGGCVPEEKLDIQIDYESLQQIGAMMGSGGLVVMDENTCMVDVARFFMDFIQRESCGKCIPCREGTRKMHDILNMITKKKGTKDLERFKGVIQLRQLAEVIKETSLCGLGQSAPNPILSTLRWFKKEYEEHIYERKCSAKVCVELIEYTIDGDKCKGCTMCAKKCPINAIIGSVKNPHHIISERCIRCGLCMDTCKFNAIHKISGGINEDRG